MKNKNMIVIIALAVVLVGGMYFFGTKDNGKLLVKEEPPVVKPVGPIKPKAQEIAVGELAPDFTLKNLQGEEVSLSDFKGKIVMINFWASWCKFCDQEMPDMQKLSSENDDLVVLAVDVQENIKDVEAYIKKGGYDFTVVLDSDGSVSKAYLVNGLPNSYFVDKEGILLGALPTMLTYAQMDEIIKNIRELE